MLFLFWIKNDSVISKNNYLFDNLCLEIVNVLQHKRQPITSQMCKAVCTTDNS